MTRSEQQRADLEALIGAKYEVLGRIGGGGMAQVMLARHRQHGGLFAVKILADHLAQDASIVARFQQEATTAASLSGHPNIVSIFDIGEGNGLHYLIMQFVCGEDLGSYLRRCGPLSLPEAAGVIAQTAEALAWAESKRVVHRDLKPANMHLDTAGRIKILDFGISKVADLADGLTRPGESLGTPFYMSPEQIRGEGCDTRSDLYSLGVVFFELLTGRRPFENESVIAIQTAHLSTPAPSPLAYVPSLPPVCAEIIGKLLAKNREDRYNSAKEFLEVLHAQGADSGPTTLRPQLDPVLQAQIDRAPLHPGEAPVSVCETEPVQQAPTPAKAETRAASVRINAQPAAPLPEVPSSPAPAARASRRMVPLAAGSAAVLLLAVLGLIFALHRRAVPPTSVNVALPQAEPAPSFEDAHGRMVLVPSGSFVFGADAPDSQEKQEQQTLPAFYVDQTEVSNADYLRFVQATGRKFSGAAIAAMHPDFPATGLSQLDAAAYAAWAGKRLPTEAEWEKAARGTDGRLYPWGNVPWTSDTPKSPFSVTAYPERQSPVGALNMAGDVWEWTASPFPAGAAEFADLRRALHSDTFSRTWYTLKGGNFPANGPARLQTYQRRGFPEDLASPMIGFRCVRDVSGAPVR